MYIGLTATPGVAVRGQRYMMLNTEHITKILTEMGIALLSFIVGWVVITILIKLLRKILVKSNIDKSLHAFITNGIRVIFLIVLAIIILQELGLNTSSLLTVLGAGGAAIALALKDSLGNVAGGFLILINKPFKCGDVIAVNGSVDATGIVDEIDLMYTKMHTGDNKVVTVPNGVMSASVLTNFTETGIRRIDKVYKFAKDTDIAKVKEVLLSVAKSNPLVLSTPEPIIGVSSIDAYALSVDFKLWCKADDLFMLSYKIEEAVTEALRAAEIDLSYTNIDIHMQ